MTRQRKERLIDGCSEACLMKALTDSKLGTTVTDLRHTTLPTDTQAHFIRRHRSNRSCL